MKHIFLIGMLCGVMITAAFTYVFAIPLTTTTGKWRSGIAVAELGRWTKMAVSAGNGPLTRAPTSVLQSQS